MIPSLWQLLIAARPVTNLPAALKPVLCGYSWLPAWLASWLARHNVINNDTTHHAQPGWWCDEEEVITLQSWAIFRIHLAIWTTISHGRGGGVKCRLKVTSYPCRNSGRKAVRGLPWRPCLRRPCTNASFMVFQVFRTGAASTHRARLQMRYYQVGNGIGLPKGPFLSHRAPLNI